MARAKKPGEVRASPDSDHNFEIFLERSFDVLLEIKMGLAPRSKVRLHRVGKPRKDPYNSTAEFVHPSTETLKYYLRWTWKYYVP